MGKWTRRAVLSAGVIAGGGMLVGVGLRPGDRAGKSAPFVEGEGETLVHSFVKISADNTITAIVPHSEMGQGAQTALAQMLAEELEADWKDIRVEEAPPIAQYANHTVGRGYLLKDVNIPGFVIPTVEGVMMRLADSLGMQVTGGSMSVRVTGVYGMRVAGAATLEMLRRAAAKAWRVPFGEVEAENSMLIHRASSRSEAFAVFAEAAAQMKPSYTPKLKSQADFKVMGTSVQRFDIPSKVDGTAEFALDVRLPDMLYATVIRSPIFGGRIVSLNDEAARAVPGVREIVRLPAASAEGLVGGYTAAETVAVVADGYWAAHRGLRALSIEWDGNGNEQVSSDTIRAQHIRDIEASVDRKTDVETGDVAGALEGSETVLTADYTVPFLAHSCMEPLNATAHYQDGRCEVWVGGQNPLGFKRSVADALGIKPDQVTLHNKFMGGGFGRKSVPDWPVQAALISKAVGKPVQLIWSREEDTRQDFYRPAVHSRFRAALSTEGALTAWENTYANKMEPVEAPVIPYSVPNQDIGAVQSPSHVPWGAWRSVDESQHGFFTECFIDECAHAAGQDPLAYRMALLADHPRFTAILERLAAETNWNRPLGSGRARGVAIKESFGSIVGQVAEITVVGDVVSLDRFVVVADPGLAVSPDGFTAQMESGIVYGLSAAMYGEITIADGAVEQSNFHDYEALRMSATPVIETHIINSGAPTGGAGEPGTPPAAPALANAIFAATGKRIRDLPLRHHVKFSTGATS